MINHRRIKNGFSLLEMLLVLVIASSLIVMFLNFTTQQSRQQQQNKTALQMQQILSAALSFYNQNGRWPGTVALPTSGNWNVLAPTNELISQNFLPAGPGAGGVTGAWLNAYSNQIMTGFDSSANVFYVAAYIRNNTAVNPITTAAAQIIAGQLPSGIVVGSTLGTGTSPPPTASSCTAAMTCYAIASVPPPGQNLNNARSINFGSLYKSGQCVPVPNCPSGMSPQIFAVPVQVSGTFDNTNTTSPPVYPISSYTAYATAMATTPQNCTSDGTAGGTQIGMNANCSNTTNVTGGYQNKYWRVCLSIVTQKGLNIPSTSQDTQNMGTIMAITRCVPTNEPTGSKNFNVYN